MPAYNLHKRRLSASREEVGAIAAGTGWSVTRSWPTSRGVGSDSVSRRRAVSTGSPKRVCLSVFARFVAGAEVLPGDAQCRIHPGAHVFVRALVRQLHHARMEIERLLINSAPPVATAASLMPVHPHPHSCDNRQEGLHGGCQAQIR